MPSPSLLSGLLEAAQEFTPLPPLHTQVHREPLKALLTQVSAPKCPPFSPSPYPFLTCWAPECPPPTIPVRGLSLRGSLLPHLRSTTIPNHTIRNQFIPYHTIPNHTIPYHDIYRATFGATSYKDAISSALQCSGEKYNLCVKPRVSTFNVIHSVQ